MTAADLIGQVFLPLSLAIIMLGMGMTLVPFDFTRVVKYPKAILIGLTNQLIFLPIIGFSLAILFNLNPIMAVGLMVLAACPGGPTSNLITQVCKGNIALSVTLTAIASVVSIVHHTAYLVLCIRILRFRHECHHPITHRRYHPSNYGDHRYSYFDRNDHS